MEETTFGEILRQTRERKGLDLNATARRLRIRPDILRAIEAGNFAAMPPRGYTRNMITGYARYLGLNPTEITGMYLSELGQYESGITASRRRGTGFDMSDAPENTRFPRRGGTSRFSVPGGSRNKSRDAQGSRSNRRRSSRDGSYADGLESMSRSRAYSHGNGNVYPDSQMRRSRGTVLPSSSFIDQRPFESQGILGAVRSRLPFIIAAIVILIIVLVVATLLFGGRAEANKSAVSTMPVTGLSDSSSTTEESSSAKVAPTEATFEYEVPSGKETYMEIYVDGNPEKYGDIKGPAQGSYTFTDNLKFVCIDKDAVTVKIQGNVVELEETAKGSVNTTWEFTDILNQWKKENGLTSSSKTTSKSSNKASSASTSRSS